VLEHNKLQLQDVVRVYPVLCGLAHEVLLLSSCRRIAFDGVSSCADDVIESRELHDVRVVVVLEEGLALEAGGEDGLEEPACVFLLPLASIEYVRASHLRRAS
jgi:hypothetical protein